MDFPRLKSIIEGLLFMVGDEGLSTKQLAELTDQDNGIVLEALQELRAELERQGRGLRVTQVAGGYRLSTNPQHAVYFERLAYTPSRASLSQAALETLSIVAYRQPITRVDIEEIRGVKCERALQSLVAKDLVEAVGRAEVIGRPILYGTTRSFLDYFGLAGLEALPEPSALDPEDMLDEQTQLLFEKLDQQQLTIDELPPQRAHEPEE
ncbi:SMC-Scp complex subunit ScpB [Paenibacillus sp. IB182496]|uniref:Segregation and condensation protein B n=1 Tax=Paenibacillus sabuli TaxID=2772509 RepID=A0A927GT77_9BACL|nr:SMC-Scp complex subunit ScpB [Paenibacillus sabuli]MBD2846810.1 SMC-Scp complex subunit ScpB [Paenibacillus sabuli]